MNLRPRVCPVCGSADRFTVFAPAKLDADKLNEYAFASRKVPELMHHRLLHCEVCDVVYASPAPEPEVLEEGYREASFDSGEEARFASKTYIDQIEELKLPDKVGALDIGTGDGAFLERLLEHGFSQVQGVEPSTAPFMAAAPKTRELIRHAMFSVDDFQPDSMSLVTCFQTIEHVDDPKGLAKSALNLLKPGGAFVIVCHSYRAASNKLLGRRSPIYDIEHLQLFSPASATRLMTEAGYGRVRAKTIYNRYPLPYWLKISPVPGVLKDRLQAVIAGARLARVALPMPAGNLVVIGYRP